MIAAWLTKAASPLIKAGIIFVIGAGLALAAALVGLKAIDMLDQIINDRVTTAVTANNAVWEAKIEKANAFADKQVAAQAREVIQIQAAASDQVQSAQQQLAELKVKSAQLPNRPDCGLSAGRVGLLPD